jgi:hypothetical protein
MKPAPSRVAKRFSRKIAGGECKTRCDKRQRITEPATARLRPFARDVAAAGKARVAQIGDGQSISTLSIATAMPPEHTRAAERRSVRNPARHLRPEWSIDALGM